MQTKKKVYLRQFRIFWLVLALLLSGWTGMRAQTLSSALDSFLADPDLYGAGLGFSLMDNATGKVVAARQADKIMIPASTFKLVTTAAAIEYLGAGFRFRTEWLYSGIIEGGILRGDLILRGYGDPTLCSAAFPEMPALADFLDTLVQAVRSAGIQSVEGQIIVDGSYFEVPPEQPLWNWLDLGNYYASGAWGVNIHDNLYFLALQQTPTINTTPAIAKIEPEVPGLVLLNELNTAGPSSGDNAYIFGAPFQDRRIVRGTIPSGRGLFTIKGSLPDPEIFAAHHISLSLQAAGIAVTGGYRTHRTGLPATRQERIMKTVYSPPLLRVVEVANKTSNNLVCESLIRYMAKQKKGGRFLYQGSELLSEWLRDNGIEPREFYIDDGSGLSMRNGITPGAFTRLLRGLRRKEYFDTWYQTLPEAGKEGTLKHAFTTLPPKWMMRAKSGTLGRVRCYTGYLKGPDGKEYSFCFMANFFTCTSTEVRKKMEKVLSTVDRL